MKVSIEKVVFGGKGLSRLKEKVCFVPFTLPEEVVEVEIKEEKKSICEGFPVDVLEKNPYRVEPKCKYYMQCGGCDFQHINYEKQVEIKKEILEETLQRIGKINKDTDKVIPSANPFNYRNRVQFKFDGKNFGFYKLKTNEVVDIESCDIADENINNLIPTLKNLAKNNPHVEELHIFHPPDNKPTLKIVLKENLFMNIENLLDTFAGIGVYIGNKRVKLEGKSFTFYRAGKFNYRVSIDSFFQVNKYQLENIVDEVISEIPKDSQCIGDIYCGVGLFTLPASKKAEKVFGIEASKSAVKDAQYNVKVHNIGNAKFYQKVVEKSADIIFGYNPDTLIFDPPRTGIPKNIIQKLLQLKSLKRIIYVSCNPSTASRDINLLSEKFELKKVKLIDMFPQTHHIESIFVLDKV